MKIINKDITTISGPAIIVHGVNCDNKMGSGVAKALADKWPSVKESYHKYEPKMLGVYDSVIVNPEENILVVNAFTQQYCGTDGRRYAYLPAIVAVLTICMLAIRIEEEQDEVTLYIPKIGCGLGGLNWKEEVEPALKMLCKAFPDVNLVVCELKDD